MERNARILSLALWVVLVELALLATQTLPFFFHTPVIPTIGLGILALFMGGYGYWADRLTPSKAVYAMVTILLLCAIPKIVAVLMGWDWLLKR